MEEFGKWSSPRLATRLISELRLKLPGQAKGTKADNLEERRSRGCTMPS